MDSVMSLKILISSPFIKNRFFKAGCGFTGAGFKSQNSDAEFEASLVYKVRFRTAMATQENLASKTYTATTTATQKKMDLFSHVS